MTRSKNTKAPAARARSQKKKVKIQPPVETEEESSDEMFVKERSPPAAKATNISKVTNEYEEDPGRSASQDFLTAIKDATTRKRDAKQQATRHSKDFKKSIHNNQQDLLSFIDTRQAEFIAIHAQALQTFRTVYNSNFALPPDSADVKAIDMRNETFSAHLQQRSVAALHTAETLQADFYDYEDCLIRRKADLLADKSPCNFEDVEGMLSAGYAVGQNTVEYLVNNRKEQEVTSRDVKEVKDEFYTSLDPSRSTWNKTSRDQLKVMKRIARIVHEE